MSVLLTDEAVRAGATEVQTRWPEEADRATVHAMAALEAFLRFHATDGRDALVDVLTAKSGYHGLVVDRGLADRVVTALFGEATRRPAPHPDDIPRLPQSIFNRENDK